MAGKLCCARGPTAGNLRCVRGPAAGSRTFPWGAVAGSFGCARGAGAGSALAILCALEGANCVALRGRWRAICAVSGGQRRAV